METFLIDRYILENKDYFLSEDIERLKIALSTIPNEMYDNLKALDLKNPKKMMLISLFFGFLGLDRFMLKDYFFGFIKLLFGGFIIGWVIDLFLIKNETKKYNRDLILSITNPITTSDWIRVASNSNIKEK